MILLNTVPWSRSWAQKVETGHQGDLTKVSHSKKIKFTQVYDKW